MELREAIDVISGRKDTPISDKIEASSVINYAVADGTLIPADQCYEVREGYGVVADDPMGMSVPLSEALSIRSADDVRREAFREALDLFESRPDAVKVIRAMIKGGGDELAAD